MSLPSNACAVPIRFSPCLTRISRLTQYATVERCPAAWHSAPAGDEPLSDCQPVEIRSRFANEEQCDRA